MTAAIISARAAILWVASLVAISSAHAAEQFELHLVLAFDVSASVNDSEFALQRDGTARALRHPSVVAAVEKSPGGIAISIVQWSSIRQQALGLGWHSLQTHDDVLGFADKVRDMPRRLPGGGTMIHAGLDFAAEQLATAPGTARRQVIDPSANGHPDDLDEMVRSRDRLLRQGVTINGLAVEEDIADLTAYFRTSLIGGPGAFVVTATDHDDFFDAMRAKLFREISGAVYSDADPRTWRMTVLRPTSHHPRHRRPLP